MDKRWARAECSNNKQVADRFGAGLKEWKVRSQVVPNRWGDVHRRRAEGVGRRFLWRGFLE